MMLICKPTSSICSRLSPKQTNTMPTSCINHLPTQPSWLLLLLLFFGFLPILKLIFSSLKWFYNTFLRPPKDLKAYGSWALITGATDGIGKAFAHQLAQKGINLVLLGRNFDKLERVSDEIQAESPNIKIKIVLCDFSRDASTSIIKTIEDATNELEVGVLINNVGVTHQARYFHEVDERVWMDIVRVNLENTTRVTRAVLKGMLKRKRGAIVNIGSASAIVVPSHPLHAIYAATKGYIDQLSRSLHVEYKHNGIDVQCQVPLYVATKMASKVASIEKSSLFIPTPDNYARAAIRHIGYEARCTPYWAHSLQWCFANLLPEAALDAWRLSIGISRREKNL
ncbi:adh_short domain-containing protein [Cephalotus follicularis]|uniref:Adh_short domain-containing protein n=1 Tax=Cephalotus follicularis TaxID=3775 RepID=A0A1Q3C5V2_CEPFO|nr:adh_short domain-containing protein [Cephalotus follicularis]